MEVNFTPADMMEYDWHASTELLHDHLLVNALEEALSESPRHPSNAMINRLIAYSATVPVSALRPSELN